MNQYKATVLDTISGQRFELDVTASDIRLASEKAIVEVHKSFDPGSDRYLECISIIKTSKS